MKKLFILVLSSFSIAVFGQAPGSEIILFDLKLKKGKVTISNPRNITNHAGYDNQPSFHSDLPFIYYSSADADGRTDIKRYDFLADTTVNITTTSEREYSPTLTPDKQYLSCIIQRDNGAQDLGKYPVDGGDPSLIIDNLTVGYHLWADNSHLVLFILGKTQGDPNTLHYLRLPTKEDTVVATRIGRSFHKVSHQRAFTYVQRVDTVYTIMKMNTETMKATPVINTPRTVEADIALTQDGFILSSNGNGLLFTTLRKPKDWKVVEVLEGADLLKGVTRIAVNATGDKLAVVVAE